jgi:Putative heavy-metal-binding
MTAMQSGGTWGSALSADEFAAIRGAGFEPVGQVFGAAVYAAGSASGAGCPGAWQSPGGLEPFVPLVQARYEARQTAIDRMIGECARLGGHGVVGVRLSQGALPTVLGGLQITVIGTAVRAPGAASAPPPPFTCTLSGQDFAKLITTGWVVGAENLCHLAGCPLAVGCSARAACQGVGRSSACGAEADLLDCHPCRVAAGVVATGGVVEGR